MSNIEGAIYYNWLYFPLYRVVTNEWTPKMYLYKKLEFRNKINVPIRMFPAYEGIGVGNNHST